MFLPIFDLEHALYIKSFFSDSSITLFRHPSSSLFALQFPDFISTNLVDLNSFYNLFHLPIELCSITHSEISSIISTIQQHPNSSLSISSVLPQSWATQSINTDLATMCGWSPQ